MRQVPLARAVVVLAALAAGVAAGCNAVQVQQDCAYLSPASIVSIESVLSVAKDGGAPYEDAVTYASQACADAADPAQCARCWLAMVDYVYAQ